MQKDFRDDLYAKESVIPADIFVSHHKSEQWADVMLVLNQEKIVSFKNEMPTLMSDYFVKFDEQESKRFEDIAKSNTTTTLTGLAEMAPEDLQELRAKILALAKDMKKDVSHRRTFDAILPDKVTKCEVTDFSED